MIKSSVVRFLVTVVTIIQCYTYLAAIFSGVGHFWRWQ
jgi:Na+(H+)/acetate symporter ActP